MQNVPEKMRKLIINNSHFFIQEKTESSITYRGSHDYQLYTFTHAENEYLFRILDDPETTMEKLKVYKESHDETI